MRRFLPLLCLAALGLTSLACMTVSRAIFGEPPTPTALPATSTLTPVPTLTPLPTPTPAPTPDFCPNGDCITSCLAQLDSLPQANGGETKSTRKYFVSNDEYTLVTYSIHGSRLENPINESGLPQNLQAYQKDLQSQAQIWDYFAAIIPPANRTFLKQYIVFTDGKDNILASVAQSDTSAAEWVLSVDIMDAANPQDLTFTLVHEYGHLLTLNPDQVPPSQEVFDNPESESAYSRAEAACSTYFPGEGCANSDSYIYRFVGRFWGKIYADWTKIDQIEDEDAYYDALDQFYTDHADEFVSDYAPTSPAEDIAETFSFFILQPRPTGKTLADQKILFFYDFPELVELRNQMGRRLCGQLSH
jgi:hypothetical protein